MMLAPLFGLPSSILSAERSRVNQPDVPSGFEQILARNAQVALRQTFPPIARPYEPDALVPGLKYR